MRLVLALCLALFPSCAKARPGIPPRHLLLLTCEGFRADRASAYLAPAPTTSLPSTAAERGEGRAMGFDDLAAAGVLFAHCATPEPRTAPALASLFTGLAPASAGIERAGDRLGSGVPTLAELFAASGFRTAAFVTRGNEEGIETNFARGFATVQAADDDAETLARAREWLTDDTGDGSRRFTWVHLAGTLPPFDRAARTREVEEGLEGKSFGPVLDERAVLEILAARRALDASSARALAATYDAAMARTALAIAGLLDGAFDYTRPSAEESETWARTVFAFTATGGCLLGEDGRAGCVDGVHEALTRVPLVLHHPDSLTGSRVSEEPVELADLLPTFVDWFGLPTPARVEGRSLLALLDSYVERPFERRPTVSRAGADRLGVRDERWHLVVERADGRVRVRLFEPERDPAEREDLAARHPDVVLRLLEWAGPAAAPE